MKHSLKYDLKQQHVNPARHFIVFHLKMMSDELHTPNIHYLVPVPGPSPAAPLPPGESRREMLRR